MKINRAEKVKKETTYEKIPHFFTNDETLLNNNGCWYKVIDADDQERVIFRRVTDNAFVLAIFPQMYLKTETINTGKATYISTKILLEWQSGQEYI